MCRISICILFFMLFIRQVSSQSCNDNRDCRNGGSCRNDGTCNCSDGYFGTTCEMNCPGPPYCQNGGECRKRNDMTYECICASGFVGKDCEFADCPTYPCQNGGICFFSQANATMDMLGGCICSDGWTGLFCEERQDCTSTMPCQNGGTCMQNGQCSCDLPFTGMFCETSPCSSNPCQNGGTCLEDLVGGGMYNCYCIVDYFGQNCEIAGCASNPCQNGGVCSDSGGTYTCTCSDGFFGINCEVNLNHPCYTDSNPCFNMGECIVLSDTEFMCNCTGPWIGQYCEIELSNPCDQPNPCRNGGRCFVLNGTDFFCDCSVAWTGFTCEVPDPCVPMPCSNGGSCVDYFNGTYECICSHPYYGDECELRSYECDFVSCLNGGTCEDLADGGYLCVCTTEFTGTQCRERITSNNPNGSSPLLLYIIIGAAGFVMFLFIILIIVCLCWRRKNNTKEDKKRLKRNEVEMKNISMPPSMMGKAPPNLYIPLQNRTDKSFPRERLRIIEEIGSGAFATVYKAEAHGILNVKKKSIVAVKQLKENATETDRQDFKKELQLYQSLELHPNVVCLLGFCIECAPSYIILEYVPNGNLQSHLRKILSTTSNYTNKAAIIEDKYLTSSELLTFAIHISRGMEFLSAKQCIHRDLATRNILLGKNMVCKISDFGLARDMVDNNTYEMKSRGRVPVRWMAPESLVQNTYTTKSDVWSFGVCLWEIVTLGSHPYPHLSSRQVVEEVKNGQRLPKPDHCEDRVYDLMTKCWNKDPSARPSFKDILKITESMLEDAQGYLVMDKFNEADYVYLKPDQEFQGDVESEGV